MVNGNNTFASNPYCGKVLRTAAAIVPQASEKFRSSAQNGKKQAEPLNKYSGMG
jgi:hypothetical protein